MEQDTASRLADDLFARAASRLEAFRAAETVAQAFKIACKVAREFAPNSCVNLWMDDPDRGRLCRAHWNAPKKQKHVTQPAWVSVQSSDLARILHGDFDTDSDTGWLPSTAFFGDDKHVCSGAGGIAYLRLRTRDGQSKKRTDTALLATVCVPPGFEGDFTPLRPYFRLIGQGFLHAVERIRKKKEQELLLKIADLFVGQKSFRTFFDEVATGVRNAFGAQGCSVFMYDEYGGRLSLAGTTGVFHTDTGEPFSSTELADLTYRRDEGLTGWIFRHQKVVRLYNASCQDEWRTISPAAPIQPAFKSAEWPSSKKRPFLSEKRPFLGAPIFDHGKFVGVIRLHGKVNGRCFLPSDERLLVAVSRVLGRSIAQWAYEIDVRESLRLQDKFLSEAPPSPASPGFEASLSTFAEQAMQLLQGCAAAISFVDGELVDPQSAVQVMSPERIQPKPESPQRTNAIQKCVTDKAMVVQQYTGGSYACAPVLIGDRVVGVVTVDSERPHWFRDRDPKLSLLEQLAAQIAFEVGKKRQPLQSAAMLSVRSALHDFKNDFASINLFVSQLPDSSATGMAADDWKKVTELKNFTKRRSTSWTVLEQVAAFDRLRFQPVYLNELIREKQELFEGLRTCHAIEFQYELDPKLDPQSPEARRVLIDPWLFSFIPSNLLRNSIDSMNGTGVITIRTELAAESANFVVADQGVGLPAELKKLDPWVPFSTKGRQGIGRVLVHSIAQLHGGRLSYLDTDSVGTTALVSFPIARDGDRV